MNTDTMREDSLVKTQSTPINDQLAALAKQIASLTRTIDERLKVQPARRKSVAETMATGAKASQGDYERVARPQPLTDTRSKADKADYEKVGRLYGYVTKRVVTPDVLAALVGKYGEAETENILAAIYEQDADRLQPGKKSIVGTMAMGGKAIKTPLVQQITGGK